jgi:hypothetical protein
VAAGRRCGCLVSETLQLLRLLLLNLKGTHDITVFIIAFLATDFKNTTSYSSNYLLHITFLLLGTLLGFRLIQASTLAPTTLCATIQGSSIILREEYRK